MTNYYDKSLGCYCPPKTASNTNQFKNAGYGIPGDPSRSALKAFYASSNSPDYDTAPKVEGSRAFSRDTMMNTGPVPAIMRRMKTNVVGRGLKVQPEPDQDYLQSKGVADSVLLQFKADAKREFDLWAGKKTADSRGLMNFYELQALMLSSTFINGDTIYTLPWKKPLGTKNFPYETRVNLIEADLVRNPPEYGPDGATVSGKDIVMGVEMKQGEVFRYWVANHYECDYLINDSVKKFTPINVRDSKGREQIFIFALSERIGQRRGMPWLAPILEQVKMASILKESTLKAALIQSFFSVMISDPAGAQTTMQQAYTPENSFGGGGSYGPEDAENIEAREEGWETNIEMGPGTVNYLGNKQVNFADPKRLDGAFKPFYDALMTEIAATCGIPREVVLLEFNKSYSASRAALLQAWKWFMECRELLQANFCNPVYSSVIEEGILKGRITAPGYFEDYAVREAWLNNEWTGDGMGAIDPEKETRAEVLSIQHRLSTYKKEYNKHNSGNWSDAMHELSEEKKLLKELNIEVFEDSEELVGEDGIKDKKEGAADENKSSNAKSKS